jgi:hypothetical protein
VRPVPTAEASSARRAKAAWLPPPEGFTTSTEPAPRRYEADMRHLIDTYIEADGARRISDFDGIGLLDLIVKSGIATAVNELPPGIQKDTGAVPLMAW